MNLCEKTYLTVIAVKRGISQNMCAISPFREQEQRQRGIIRQ